MDLGTGWRHCLLLSLSWLTTATQQASPQGSYGNCDPVFIPRPSPFATLVFIIGKSRFREGSSDNWTVHFSSMVLLKWHTRHHTRPHANLCTRAAVFASCEPLCRPVTMGRNVTANWRREKVVTEFTLGLLPKVASSLAACKSEAATMFKSNPVNFILSLKCTISILSRTESNILSCSRQNR